LALAVFQYKDLSRMMFQRGFEIQRGRGIGSTLQGLYKSIFPLSKSGGNASIQAAAGYSNKNNEIVDEDGKLANSVDDDSSSDNESNLLEIAKKKVDEAVKGRRRKRKSTPKPQPTCSKKVKKCGEYNLFDD